ncbi:MAG: gliding motility-associated C-terminal domain-containing protein, partial [Taibaiella sp.]|nr:gliding motility-associated C-terminal domain-containing protein [Taibaiella sp.]
TSSTGGTGSTTAPTPSTATAGTFNYYVTQTVNGCESPRAALRVTINPKPAPPGVTPPTYCQYDLPSPLTATGSGLLWYGPSTSGSSTAPTPNTSVPGIDTYYVTQTILGCVSDRAIDPVTIITKPNPPVVEDTSYCQFVNAPALTAIGSNLKWYSTASGGSALSAIPVPTTTTVGATTWYVSQTVNGCESDRAAITVTILYLPSFNILPGKSFVCQNDTLTLHYNGPSLTAGIFNWVLPNGTTYISGDANSQDIVVKFDSLYMQYVVLTASSYAGRCYTSDTLKVNVVYQPTADAYIKENICLGDTITLALSARSGNADHFIWNFDGGNIITANSNTGGPYSVSWQTKGLHIVKITPFTKEGCKGIETMDTVKVRALPDARIFSKEQNGVICLEDSVFLKAYTEEQGVSYRWTPAHFFNFNNKVGIWGKIETVGYVRLLVTDAFGCSAEDSVLITPESCCTVRFPLAFTPNGDGKNDYFRPLFDGFHRFHMFRILNRWGQTVFESTNNKMEWDGTFGGVPQDMGVYYFVIKYDCEDGKTGREKIEKGEVTLIR